MGPPRSTASRSTRSLPPIVTQPADSATPSTISQLQARRLRIIRHVLHADTVRDCSNVDNLTPTSCCTYGEGREAKAQIQQGQVQSSAFGGRMFALRTNCQSRSNDPYPDSLQAMHRVRDSELHYINMTTWGAMALVVSIHYDSLANS